MFASLEKICYNFDLIKSDKAGIIYGVVLIPGVKDKQGHTITAEEIEKAYLRFVDKGLENRIDVQHDHRIHPGLKIVENWIAQSDLTINGKKIKKGSWVIAVKVEEPDVWKAIKERKLTGFSIEGRARISNN